VKIKLTGVYVDDQNKALRLYVEYAKQFGIEAHNWPPKAAPES